MTRHHSPLALSRATFSREWEVVRVGQRNVILDRWPLALESQMQLDDAITKAAWLDALLAAIGKTRDELADHFDVELTQEITIDDEEEE